MNLSALPPPLLSATSLSPIGPRASVGSRLDATKASSAQFELPLGLSGASTLHISPHDPSWSPDQYEHAFVSALCAQGDAPR
jgi:hypothetical protein